MNGHEERSAGVDLNEGLSLDEIDGGGVVRGTFAGDEVLVCKSGAEYFAVGAFCTHYGAPLEDGMIADGTIRCPWHQACFSLRTGEALAAPAFDALARYDVHIADGRLHLRKPDGSAKPAVSPARPQRHPENIVMVGGGAAAFAAAEMLRRKGYERELIMITEESDAPYDRPNLSKDFLAGTAPEEWIPLKPAEFYEENNISLRRGKKVVQLDAERRKLYLSDGSALGFDRLLLATGAEARRPDMPGAENANVHTLRSLSDCRKLIGRLDEARSVSVVGAGFLGLEITASLRARGLAVTVVSPEAEPMQAVFGATLARYLVDLHRSEGVGFRLGAKPVRVSKHRVLLEDGETLAADLVVLATGARPRVELAVEAGLDVGTGIRTDAHLETSAPGIFAAGDAIEWFDADHGQWRHVEHWSLAQRHGQIAALNMLGESIPFRSVPFFWSTHYGRTVQYNGYAPDWDEENVSGSIEQEKIVVELARKGRLLAAATLGNERKQLQMEQRLEGRSP